MKTKCLRVAFYLNIVVLALVAISSCVNIDIKSDYPEIKYYNLSQENSILKNIDTINAALLVRFFTSEDMLESTRLHGKWEDGRIQLYYYHRWISESPALITDFVIERFNKYNIFSKGTFNSSSMVLGDYVLEGNILEMMAYNNKDEKLGSNYIALSIQITLIKRPPFSVEKNVVFSKVYSAKEPRPDNKPSSIPNAMSIGISKICDYMVNDFKLR